MNNVIKLETFKFNTLHKYMTPIYARLNLHLEDHHERKKFLCDEIIPSFFKRLREYRGVVLESISAHYKIDLKTLQLFEKGVLIPEDQIIHAYVWSCNGHREFGYFKQRIREFQTPFVKINRIASAKKWLSKGVIFEGINYQKLYSKEADVLTFHRKDR